MQKQDANRPETLGANSAEEPKQDNKPDGDDKKAPVSFSPEVTNDTLYRFRCPGPGVYQCDLTQLVFVMAREAELRYKALIWDENLLQSANRMPAGLLFDIKSSEESAVLQLHLPHAETKEALRFKGLLSVVHITDDGMSILEPLEITDSHVVVNVPYPAGFGLIWDVVKRFLNMSLPVKGQILVYLRPPYNQYQVIELMVLQKNVPVHEVAVQSKVCQPIAVSTDCLLTYGHVYSVHCEPKCKHIQPESEEFLTTFGPNYPPTFEVFVTHEMGDVTLRVQDQDKKVVWKRLVPHTDPREEYGQSNAPAADKQ